MAKDKRKKLEGILGECFHLLSKDLSKAIAGHFSCFRGDSWQFVVGDARYAASAAVCYRTLLRQLGCERIGIRLNSSASIGIGTIDFFPDSESAAGSGIAYELSGRNLDRIKKRLPGMNFAGLGEHDRGVTAVLGLIDAMITRWTEPQVYAVHEALKGHTQNEIALGWKNGPISQQAVHKHLQNAGWPAVLPALEWISTTIRSCISGNNQCAGAGIDAEHEV